MPFFLSFSLPDLHIQISNGLCSCNLADSRIKCDGPVGHEDNGNLHCMSTSQGFFFKKNSFSWLESVSQLLHHERKDQWGPVSRWPRCCCSSMILFVISEDCVSFWFCIIVLDLQHAPSLQSAF